MYQIEKNVPIPTKAVNGGRPPLYPFAEMQVSDSFSVPGKDSGKKAARAAYAHSKQHGSKFTTRAENDGVRIWRVK